MHIEVKVRVLPTRSGVHANCPALGLSAHGEDDKAAIEALRSTVGAWATALIRVGELENAASNLDFELDPNGDDVTILATDGEP